uniref:Uncharacterized protein n=1 Tax=Octopus bimaculoides TaxID=37653 RepID=A0A0L8IBZ4_OCTBM
MYKLHYEMQMDNKFKFRSYVKLIHFINATIIDCETFPALSISDKELSTVLFILKLVLKYNTCLLKDFSLLGTFPALHKNKEAKKQAHLMLYINYFYCYYYYYYHY